MPRPRSRPLLLLLSMPVWPALFACVPKRDIPAEQIPKLTALDQVMDVQATVADPQFKKIGEASYSDADWVAFADVGTRLQVTSTKIHEFSKGEEFNKFADQLHEKAALLSAAAQAKDAAAASKALSEMKVTCKECHAKYK